MSMRELELGVLKNNCKFIMVAFLVNDTRTFKKVKTLIYEF